MNPRNEINPSFVPLTHGFHLQVKIMGNFEQGHIMLSTESILRFKINKKLYFNLENS